MRTTEEEYYTMAVIISDFVYRIVTSNLNVQASPVKEEGAETSSGDKDSDSSGSELACQ
jgi:hypothetical protein